MSIGFKYNDRIAEYNREIDALLREHYHLILPEDLELFQSVILDHERMRVEVGPDGMSALPLSAASKVGILQYARGDFIDRVRVRLQQKQRLLDYLLRPWWQRLFSIRRPQRHELPGRPAGGTGMQDRAQTSR